MDGILIAGIVGAIAAVGTAGAALLGLRYARRQIDSVSHDHRVDRVLDFHRDLTTGDVGDARSRFSELMFRVGEEAFGAGHCWRPTWNSLLPPDPKADVHSDTKRRLGLYPDDIIGGERHRPLDDLRSVLWCFERIEEARNRGASLDEPLLVSLIGYHAVWWDLLCKRLTRDGGGHIFSLVRLAEWMEEKSWRDDPRNMNRRVPEDDFQGKEDDQILPKLHLPRRQRTSLRIR